MATLNNMRMKPDVATVSKLSVPWQVGNPDGLGCGEGRLRNGGEGMPKATVTKEEVGEAILDAEYGHSNSEYMHRCTPAHAHLSASSHKHLYTSAPL